MDTDVKTLELPISLYNKLQALAAEEQLEPVEMLTQWAELASQRRAWLRGWAELRELIKQEGGLQVGTTKEEIVEQLRRTRYEIFEAEYAHLYR
jgi:hypothetical protein